MKKKVSTGFPRECNAATDRGLGRGENMGAAASVPASELSKLAATRGHGACSKEILLEQQGTQ